MKVLFALIADAVNRTETGTVNILGEFNFLYSDAFPFVRPQMAGLVRLEREASDPADQSLSVELVANSSGATMWGIKPVVLPPGGKERIDLTFDARGVVFPEPGSYRFRVSINGADQYSLPLEVSARPPAVGEV
jgi:hypothetical protein